MHIIITHVMWVHWSLHPPNHTHTLPKQNSSLQFSHTPSKCHATCHPHLHTPPQSCCSGQITSVWISCGYTRWPLVAWRCCNSTSLGSLNCTKNASTEIITIHSIYLNLFALQWPPHFRLFNVRMYTRHKYTCTPTFIAQWQSLRQIWVNTRFPVQSSCWEICWQTSDYRGNNCASILYMGIQRTSVTNTQGNQFMWGEWDIEGNLVWSE